MRNLPIRTSPDGPATRLGAYWNALAKGASGTGGAVLDRTAIYHKSAKGAEAIATRNAALSPKQRSMLILINGKRPISELAALGQGLGEPEHLIEQLADDGFIETASPTANAPTEPAPLMPASGPERSAGPPSRPPLGPTELAVPLPQAKRFAVRRLNDMLGPTAQDMCIRIEAARTPQEFRAAIRRTETILREVVGPQLAQQFTSDVENQRS
ncbi:hypothetical protein HK414_17215 [Ramlibacter terrae]|uniref:Uncharacterized protein n=1 Tax=Ramlibacter terrae TaxID=2732511 RepID=A0ABX6P5F7_9BURK|nr:hypothetical protein HK414_17215 [Ramlibacter terrae]